MGLKLWGHTRKSYLLVLVLASLFSGEPVHQEPASKVVFSTWHTFLDFFLPGILIFLVVGIFHILVFDSLYYLAPRSKVINNNYLFH